MKQVLISILSLLLSAGCYAQWTLLATDANGDGSNMTLLDGTQLEYRYDQASDSLFFRITVADWGMNATAFGVNIMITLPNGGPAFNFWGANNMDPFQRLLTCWVTGTPPATYTGTIGISDSTGVAMNNYSSLSSNNLEIEANTAMNIIIIGLKRKDLIPDASLIAGSASVKVAAAVGSNISWNDDIYDSMARMTISTLPSNVKELSGIEEIRLFQDSRNNRIVITSKKSMRRIKMTDLQGKTVYVNHVSSRTHEINSSTLSKGLYFLSITNKSEREVPKKILIN